MIPPLAQNLLVLIVCWVLTTGAGVYLTFVHQPKALEQAQKAEQVVRLKQTEVASLLAEAASSKEMADEAVARWQSRYKVLPDTLSSPEVVGYMNDLTRSGFKSFDVSLSGIERKADYSYYTYSIKGNAYFGSLYRFIWDVENNRRMYRIRELVLDHTDIVSKDRGSDAERMQVMVSFTMQLDAYFGGTEGMSAADQVMPGAEQQRLPVARLEGRPPVPRSALPAERPVVNPFFPIVMTQLPPNTYGLIDVEQARLIAVVGGEAVLQDAGGVRKVRTGAPVYLGHIVSVDPEQGRVVARLNKGGIVDEVELNLETEDPYRQAFGPATLAPTVR